MEARMHGGLTIAAEVPVPVAAPGPLLEFRDVSHTYRGGVQALAGVTLDIGRGMFGLLGPNGAGKSTLMRIVATLLAPTCGRVLYDGIDVTREPNRIRSVLGYLPQEFGVYPGVSAEELLDHLAVLKNVGPTKLRREQVQALLQQTNLYDVRKRAVKSFSGGMRQRFGIAQALLGDPRVVILDEPTAGLDPVERSRFHDLLAEIGESMIVILSTHLLEDVSKLCSRAAILFGGRIVAHGDLDQLIATLQGRIWRKSVPRAEVAAYRREFRVLSSRTVNGHAILHALSDERPDPSFEPVPGDLQDVYLAMNAEADERAAA
jgi:ABC-2 type transport system ATP-binding protein